jgi:hypothetical protein
MKDIGGIEHNRCRFRKLQECCQEEYENQHDTSKVCEGGASHVLFAFLENKLRLFGLISQIFWEFNEL